jgi:hypothetical protein
MTDILEDISERNDHMPQRRNNSYNNDERIPVPDPYERPLLALKVAEIKPQTFEDRWKISRQQEFDRERARAANWRPREPEVITAAELEAAKPPDPYAEGLKRLREKP